MISQTFDIDVRWTGNRGAGTADYRAYARDYEISGDAKSRTIVASSDPNTEELLIGSLSAGHMLWVLHLCADAGIIVTDYVDAASGVMDMTADHSGQFRVVTLRPRLTITDVGRALELGAIHHRARGQCFIARSVSFPVRCDPIPVTSA